MCLESLLWNLTLYKEADRPTSQEDGQGHMNVRLRPSLLIFMIWLSNLRPSLGLGLLSVDNHLIIQLSFSVS